MAIFPEKNFPENWKKLMDSIESSEVGAQRKEANEHLLEQQAKANKQHHHPVETLNPLGW